MMPFSFVSLTRMRRRSRSMARSMARSMVVALFVFGLLALHFGAAAPTALAESIAVRRGDTLEYAVPKGPLNLAVEAPGVIWFTSPSANVVGALKRTSEPGEPVVRYRVEYVGLGSGSEPYDLVYRDGTVWFTLRGTGQIGRINTATLEVQLYSIPRANSRPTGIDLAPDGQVWFAGNTGGIDKLDPASGQFSHFAFTPGRFGQPYVEQLRVQTLRSIWFTLPEDHSVGNYNPVTGEDFVVPTREQGPTGLTLDSAGRPWVTARESSAVGRYAPGTVSQWGWFSTRFPDSGPTGIATFDTPNGREVWFGEENTGTVGRLLTIGFDVQERESLPLILDEPSRPWGVVVDGEQHIWIADTERSVINETVVPLRAYFPRVAKP